MTFGIFTNSACTNAYTGLGLAHKTDLSDNPQDTQLWLGSVNALNQLQAASDLGVDQITITPTDILPVWEADTAYIVGDRVQPTVSDGFVYKCTTAGTSDSSEPSWNVGGIGSTTVDNTAVWTKVSAKHPTTEIKLALTQIGLDSAVAGDPLDLGATIPGGDDNAVTFWVRIDNTVTNIANDTSHEELDIFINEVDENLIP